MSCLHSKSYRPAGNGRDTYAIFNIGWSPAHDAHLSDPLLTQIDKWERNVRIHPVKAVLNPSFFQRKSREPPSHHPEAHYPPQREMQPRRPHTSGHERFEQVFTRLNRPTIRQHPNHPNNKSNKLASKLRQESRKATQRSAPETRSKGCRGPKRTQQRPLSSTDALLMAMKLPASTLRQRRIEFRNYGRDYSTSVA